MKILLVDDTKTVHAYIKELFKSNSEIEFSDAYNGKEALEMVGTKTYDLILLDWEMPILNGPETLKQMVAIGVQTPIVMVTTKNAPGDLMQMLTLGAKDYVMKPFTKDILAAKIEMLVGVELNDAA